MKFKSCTEPKAGEPTAAVLPIHKPIIFTGQRLLAEWHYWIAKSEYYCFCFWISWGKITFWYRNYFHGSQSQLSQMRFYDLMAGLRKEKTGWEPEIGWSLDISNDSKGNRADTERQSCLCVSILPVQQPLLRAWVCLMVPLCRNSEAGSAAPKWTASWRAAQFLPQRFWLAFLWFVWGFYLIH